MTALDSRPSDEGAPLRFGRVIRWIAETMAVLGGLVLVSLIVLTCLSVAGRGLNSLAHSEGLESVMPAVSAFLLRAGVGPIDGDFELVEAGIAFAIFAFLPICQLRREHAVVDLLTSRVHPRIDRCLAAFWECVLALALSLICWRLWLGTQGRFDNGDTTWLLQFPLWWAYAASATACTLAVLVGLYCACLRVKDCLGSEARADEAET